MAQPPPLSASHIGSFAYLTVKDRLPVILTRVVDYLCREKDFIGDSYGKAGQESCKEVIGRFSQLKNEIQTNKELIPIQSHCEPSSPYDDSDIYNAQLEKYIRVNGVPPKWFTAPWLFVECYMYTRIHEAFYLCNSLKDFDPFMDQKRKSLRDSMQATEALAAHVLALCRNMSTLSHDQLKHHVIKLVEVSVWGNRCDLSISGGADRSQHSDLLLSLNELLPNMIVNDSDSLWQLLEALPEDQRDVVLILDNAGFELVTDLCLLTFLMEAGLATSLTIHPKTRPWFVSDTLRTDLSWTIDTLREAGECAGEMANKWTNYISLGRWKITENKFWTLSYDFADMREVDPELYSQLSKASLIIFKGDLNYRKLTGDLNWPTTTGFEQALRGFFPAPVLALRTAKGGPVVGLAPGISERIAAVAPDWNISGEYGMIQLCTSS
ncbi:damage-control phosphatase ARMT1 isoform X1 [Procambarus clarkii]|uniref:damage-control phosphatase ARMT1 isoform X1 n=1 Tax=Procambarus clarkii TaxID=6728 RepID=UPI00374231DB